ESSGATVSLSSMARWGVSRHTPILPPQTSLIVAHAASDRSGTAVLGATYDHRLLTGFDVVNVLRALAQPPAQRRSPLVRPEADESRLEAPRQGAQLRPAVRDSRGHSAAARRRKAACFPQLQHPSIPDTRSACSDPTARERERSRGLLAVPGAIQQRPIAA